jgi:SWI/SNF-related matrix-associated actin-dependent regulator 1 of chromatin subfamily A
MVRRLKADVLQQLPPKLRQQIFLDVPDKAMMPVRKVQEQLAQLRARRDLKITDEKEKERNMAEERTLLNELYQVTGVAKSGAAQDHIQMMLEHEEKFLIFAHHTKVMVSKRGFGLLC